MLYECARLLESPRAYNGRTADNASARGRKVAVEGVTRSLALLVTGLDFQRRTRILVSLFFLLCFTSPSTTSFGSRGIDSSSSGRMDFEVWRQCEAAGCSGRSRDETAARSCWSILVCLVFEV